MSVHRSNPLLTPVHIADVRSPRDRTRTPQINRRSSKNRRPCRDHEVIQFGRRSSVRTRHWALDPTSPARKTAVAATERPRYKVLPSKPGRECDKVAMRLPHLRAVRLGNYRFSPSKVRQVTIARLAEPVSAVPELSSS